MNGEGHNDIFAFVTYNVTRHITVDAQREGGSHTEIMTPSGH